MTNKTPGRALLLPLLALTLLAGCSLGKDNILFVTKTSLGVDVDSKPPTLEIGFDRKEMTIAPEFLVRTDGEEKSAAILPQMAGFTSDIGIINQALGQSFATGTSAILMGKYLTSQARPEPTLTIEADEIKSTAKVTVASGSERKRYFFGTDTNFGFKVGFGLETGGLPDSLSLGYKRKELAFVPLFESTDSDSNNNEKKVVYLPSLLATAGLATDASGPREGKLVHSQFFATGHAASYLAALPEIRAVVAPKIFPEAREATEAFKKGIADSKTQQAQIAKILGHVAPDGTTVNKDRLQALFDKAEIPKNDSARKFVEGATSADNLAMRLRAARAVVDKLAAAVP